MTPRTIEFWLHRCRYDYGKYCKAEYKDGAMDDEVLDNLFSNVLPKFAQLYEMGMLTPDDFIGVTDEVDGTSMQAYEKARLRATAYTGDPRFPEGNPDALPYLAWSHDEACASSMDAEVCRPSPSVISLILIDPSFRRARGSSGASPPFAPRATPVKSLWPLSSSRSGDAASCR